MHHWCLAPGYEFGLWFLNVLPALVFVTTSLWVPCAAVLLFSPPAPLWPLKKKKKKKNASWVFFCLPGATVNAKDHVWLTPLHRAAASRNEVSNALVSVCRFRQSNYLSVRWLHPLIVLCIIELHQNIVLMQEMQHTADMIYALSSPYCFLLPRGQWVCCWGVEQRQTHETSSGRRRCMWLLPTVPRAAQRPCWPSWATWTWQIAPAELPCTTQLRVGSKRWDSKSYFLPLCPFHTGHKTD